MGIDRDRELGDFKRTRADRALARRLRRERPSPPASLLAAFAPRRRQRGQLVFAGGLTAAITIALASIGGVSYAANAVTHVVSTAKRAATTQKVVSVTRISAGGDQYSTPPLLAPGETGVPVAPAVTKDATADVAGSVSLPVTLKPVATGSSAPTAPVTANISWPANSITSNATVVATPTTLPSTGTLGAGAVAILIVVTSADGTVLHSFAVPIAVTFHNVPTDYVPTTSENGTTWRAIPLLAALPLPDGQPDGYVRDGHTLTIYTHHLSLFAVHRLKTSSTASAKAAAAAKASAAKKKAAAAAKAKAAQQSVWGPLASVRVGTLPLAIQKPAVVALPGGQIMVIGGQSSKGSSSTILVGAPEKLHAIGQLRFANYGGDAVGDAFRIGNTIWLVGGHAGDRTTSALYRIDATTGKVTPSGRFIEPLADSGVVSVAGTTYLVGGVSGTRVATAVLSYAPPSDVEIVTRLPIGVSDPSVVAVGGLIYVAGGATQSGGASKAVFVVNPAAHTVKRFATLPEGVTNASVVAAGKSLYLLGGTSAKGNPLFNLMRINLQTRRVSVVGKLTHPLIGAATVAVGNRTLVIGGKRGGVGTYSADITAITAKGGSRTALNG